MNNWGELSLDETKLELDASADDFLGAVVVFGLGYVGLPLAVHAAERGFHVYGIDSNEERVAQLGRLEKLPETVQRTSLERVLNSGLLEVSSNPPSGAPVEVCVICVPTPLSADRKPDFKPLQSALRSVAEIICGEPLIVIESTVAPGACRRLSQEVLGPPIVQGKRRYFLCHSPERVDPGNGSFSFDEVPRVLGGIDFPSRLAGRQWYERLGINLVEVSGIEEAEMAKLLENTYRQVNIALVNEFTKVCKHANIDSREVLRAASSKPYGFQKFSPGVGVGGHCIPVDPVYLNDFILGELGEESKLIDAAIGINESMPDFVATRAQARLAGMGRASGGSVLVLGVTYKPDVSDLRESPSIRLIERLRGWGYDVRYQDPFIGELSLSGGEVVKSLLLSEVEQADVDLIIIAQRHSSYSAEFLSSLKSRIMDTTGFEGVKFDFYF